MKFIKITTILSALFLLSGCAEYQLRKLEKMQLHGSEFSQSLAKEYHCLARIDLEENYDALNARHFALKGKRAARGYGERVMPERLTKREVPRTATRELCTARAWLLCALERGGRQIAPIHASKAQRYFDAWVEESERRWNTCAIKMMRALFYKHMCKMEKAVRGKRCGKSNCACLNACRDPGLVKKHCKPCHKKHYHKSCKKKLHKKKKYKCKKKIKHKKKVKCRKKSR